MRRISILTLIVFAALFNLSCANLKSSLSKSDSSGSRDYTKQPSYSSASVRSDSVRGVSSAASYNAEKTAVRNADVSTSAGGKDAKASDIPPARTSAEANQRLVNQYAEMDKLGDLVLYEIDMTERRKESLLDRFKSASSGDRENITQELNRLDNNQLTLYKAYVQVYKEGRSDWTNVRKNVENTLFNIRGIGNK